MVKFTNNSGPASAQRIAAFEKKFKLKLPADYKKFLRSTNGGVPEPNCFTVPGGGDALADFLYGIRHERVRGDLEHEQGQAAQWEPLPAGFIVIGHDPGGNRLLLATAGRDAGRVFFWDRVGFWRRKNGGNTFHVADSFTAFIDSLRELEPDA